MATVATYTKSGNKATTAAKLDSGIFGVTSVNHDLLKQAYVAYLANGRENLARTKTRGEVRGGGKKPWRQKGTGRARFGSSRVPIWRGGGVTFGPTGVENYKHAMPLKAKRTALRHALSLANASGKVAIIEAVDFKGKTAAAAALLTKIGATRNTLLVTDNKTDELMQATRNLPNLQVVSAKYLTVFDILNADNILLTQAALKVVNEWLADEKKGDK